ncbi:MAG: hypothetical protein EOR00_12595 [Mesorhizobium sp.]|nr:MAG: hypothetical protein EOR00_12595 [Mesorhizobium sp.]
MSPKSMSSGLTRGAQRLWDNDMHKNKNLKRVATRFKLALSQVFLIWSTAVASRSFMTPRI